MIKLAKGKVLSKITDKKMIELALPACYEVEGEEPGETVFNVYFGQTVVATARVTRGEIVFDVVGGDEYFSRHLDWYYRPEEKLVWMAFYKVGKRTWSPCNGLVSSSPDGAMNNVSSEHIAAGACLCSYLPGSFNDPLLVVESFQKILHDRRLSSSRSTVVLTISGEE